jgi:hypothetical protein
MERGDGRKAADMDHEFCDEFRRNFEKRYFFEQFIRDLPAADPELEPKQAGCALYPGIPTE